MKNIVLMCAINSVIRLYNVQHLSNLMRLLSPYASLKVIDLASSSDVKHSPNL